MAPDEKFMREAIRLARKGLCLTRPNPAVGCVIVKKGRIIGRGWHKQAGLPHAEIEALRSLGNPAKARGATVYVTLEPCCTHGHTPPCTRALIDAGVARVVVGAIDLNPKHRGRGLRILEKAGIKTKAGLLEGECFALNPEFNHFMSTGLPWVIAKCGMSLDGRLTLPPGESRWITSPAARRDAMKLRATMDAVMVGASTVRADDPALTVRGIRGAAQPWRVIWAPRRPPPKNSQLMREAANGRVILLKHRTLRTALRDLARRGIRRLLLEGGGHTLGRAFDQNLVREVVCYVAPVLSGGAIPAAGGRGARNILESRRIAPINYQRIGNCLRIAGNVKAGR